MTAQITTGVRISMSNREVYIIVPTCWEADVEVGLKIQAYTPFVRVVVVANTEEAPAASMIHPKFQTGYLADVPKRIGYVNAVNLGFAMIHPDTDDPIVGTINDDVEIDGDFVTPMIEALDAGAAQVGASCHGIGRDGMWDDTPGRPVFAEGWCWLAKMSTIQQASLSIPGNLVYDRGYSPGYCEDCDLSLRIQRNGGRVLQVQNLPLRHLRSQTFGSNREPFWTRNRERLVRQWNLAGSP
jgi:GT2 family glycosyltransferase